VSDAAEKPNDRRTPTPVPPRGGRGRPGSRPAGRAQANRGTSGRQARQAAQRRNRMYVLLGVLAAVVIVAVVVVVSVSGGGSSGAPRQPMAAASQTTLENIPVATLAAAAAKVTQLEPAVKATGSALTAGSKPEVLFIGAEFCPICAAERWPMTIALMKFGTFTNLQQTHSAVSDGDAGTISYYGSTYTSPYLTFTPRELYTNQPSNGYYKTLEKLTPAQQATWTANLGSNLTFPFVDFAGQMAIETAQYNPQTIYYHTFPQVLSAVGHNDNSVGAYIDASAAVFIKYLCSITKNQPASVCSAVANVAAPVTSANSGVTSPAG
jgi:hypothetical protein